MSKLTEDSIVSRANALIVGLAAVLFLGALLVTLYGWVMWQVVRPFDVFAEAVFVLMLLARAAAKYRCELDKKALRVSKVVFGNSSLYEIPLRDVAGVYRKAAKRAGARRFNRSYRLHSVLDGRPVWTVAYSQPDKRGRMENRRVYFKPSQQMLAALAELLPGKVKESEEELGGRLAKRK